MNVATDFARRRLRFIRFLGRGSFGNAYLAQDADGNCIVVKRSVRGVKDSGFLEEYLGMMDLCSLNVVSPSDAWIDDSQRVCIAMEYCDARDLGDYLQKNYPLEEEELLSTVVQLLLGLDHVHKRNRLHRDIKPANIFVLSSKVNDGKWPTIKLGDFGLVKRFSHNCARIVSRVGTPLYSAPEVIKGYGYTSKADIWSMGLVVYRLMMNKLPFNTDNVHGLTNEILALRASHPSKVSGYSSALGDCVLEMLNRNWKRRPCAHDLLKCKIFQQTLLQHPWIRVSSNDISCMFARQHASAVTVYAEPRENSEILRTCKSGDQVYLSRSSLGSGSGRGCWREVCHPCAGFVRDWDDAGSLFEPYAIGQRSVTVKGPKQHNGCRGVPITGAVS